ncbi:MAG: hypothetical protein A3C02_00775 [Candidatus Andersenbacteria bacterium RIFCSPHIGHO2_02_FULL_45_11]|uniref:Peptidase A2 domain-containing protein n=1 Tax=Candidatus Andersenbacteria bacterium RIFCSPHIGHO2_12_FULL_45_11 TaxID=1797281 RepID=A0A1G1X3T4_9BACT|nr:MAG: hypothetical protein A2805_01655 [Candidatus Andersenbacteria bacterium RIFCSPHIGHO2_01_FULL_46_36]OGY33318.1 MAG: hypothetical protein A3C02_00775 [Candidatus Andersenbacteria bacterium RIFCSPHIGHO2_02_FULL_45_11]OGY34672.1 MAG: hypothetical protein A3D99_05020 [Candidatus Andersenbacteria bacterium RIFCSPHIGHO2_12_FULL_45_11]
MKFSYKKSLITPAPGFESGLLYQSKIPVLLSGPKGVMRFDALVDTGSDQTIFPLLDIEEITGILIDRNTKSEVRGRLEQHKEELFLGSKCVLRLAVEEEVYEFPSSIWFSDDGNSPAILGHSGFLEFFTSTFDGDGHVLTLEPNKRFSGIAKKLEW